MQSKPKIYFALLLLGTLTLKKICKSVNFTQSLKCKQSIKLMQSKLKIYFALLLLGTLTLKKICKSVKFY